MADLPPESCMWLAKLTGACAGSAISLGYILPRGKREAAIRFLTGLTAGLVFGMPVGVWLADYFHIGEKIDEIEMALMGAAFSSLAIWTALGAAKRLSETGMRPSIKSKHDLTVKKINIDRKQGTDENAGS